MQENILKQIKNIASKYQTNNIYIIGKGPSIDEIALQKKLPGLAINLNDSERIYVGDIGVFSAKWVLSALEDSGYKCCFYLSGLPMPGHVSHEVLMNLDSSEADHELALFRLERSHFCNEKSVLITALKIADALSVSKKTAQTVYLLGFDFSTESGDFSQRISADYANSSREDRAAIVQSYESQYLQIEKYYLNKKTLNIIHVGNKSFSGMTAEKFNCMFSDVSRAGGEMSRSDKDDKVLIVAELTNNHLGDANRLVEMIHRAKSAGADLIKVQKRDVATFYSPEQLSSYYWSPFGSTLGAYREGVELDEKLLDILNQTCQKCGVDWFCSVLDVKSYFIIKRFNPRLIKIPSTVSEHCDLHAKIASDYKGPIVISTGFTEQSYVGYVLKTFSENEKIYLMHCVSAYPTPRSDCNVAIVGAYAELARSQPRIVPSYSSHDVGSMGSMLAVAAGARMVEKHVKLGDVEWVHFDRVALDLRTAAFSDYVRDIRIAEEMVGSPIKKILPSENHKYRNQRT